MAMFVAPATTPAAFAIVVVELPLAATLPARVMAPPVSAIGGVSAARSVDAESAKYL